MSSRPDSLAWTPLPESVCARCAHAGGLPGWPEAVLAPLPFAMCFSAAEERSGGILALPNGFLKTLVAQRFADELVRYAASVGLARIEIVVDPTVSAPSADDQALREPREDHRARLREQPPGLTTRFFAERGFWQLSPLAAGKTRQLDDLRAVDSASRQVRRAHVGTRRWCSPACSPSGAMGIARSRSSTGPHHEA
jgi:hypothetical protein